MIQLTRLNNTPLSINPDLIKFIEIAPDTVITLITNEKIMVRESVDQIVARIVVFRRALLADISAVPTARIPPGDSAGTLNDFLAQCG